MFKRFESNPIIEPNPKNKWESIKVYNPGVICENGIYHLWYNAVGQDWTLRLGYAISKDGINFKRKKNPAVVPSESYDWKGIMDPRVTKVGNKYYMTYSADNGKMRMLALAISDDLINWNKYGLGLKNWNAVKAGVFRVFDGKRHPEKEGREQRSKAGGIFSEKINGKLWMIFGNSHLWMATSKDGLNWHANFDPFLSPREGKFDGLSVQGGPPPIKTAKGWLYFYHGRSGENGDYQLGYLILATDNPRKIIYRSQKPIFKPKESYEMSGIVDILPGGFKKMQSMTKKELEDFVKKSKGNGKMPGVIFCCGAVLVDNQVRIYYGASDTVIASASAPINKFFS